MWAMIVNEGFISIKVEALYLHDVRLHLFRLQVIWNAMDECKSALGEGEEFHSSLIEIPESIDR